MESPLGIADAPPVCPGASATNSVRIASMRSTTVFENWESSKNPMASSFPVDWSDGESSATSGEAGDDRPDS